jgi:hypothetical protein
MRLCSHNRQMKTIRKFLADESGATAIEYAGLSPAIARRATLARWESFKLSRAA